jgi:predicted anti-sigma-YlaC factor YlaD
MTCERWREAISARADGEELGVDERLLDAHVARCWACQQFAATVTARPAPPIAAVAPPDLPRRVARAAALADRTATWSVVRALLAVVAIEIIVVSVHALLGEEQETSTHAARHLGAFAVAYGVGLLVVVARPARARTMLPVAGVLAGALVITSVVDLTQRRIPLVDEAAHLPEVVSVVLVWLIAVPPRHLLDRHGGAADHGLELVEAHADRELPRPGEAEVGGRLVAADPDREDLRLERSDVERG